VRRFSSANSFQKIDGLRKPGFGIFAYFAYFADECGPCDAPRNVRKMIVAFSSQGSYR
jgi:hypothetical protein